MTLYELIDAYEFADIEDHFTLLYAERYMRNAVGYEEVFETLKDFEETIVSNYVIHLTHVQGDDENPSYKHVNGKCASEECSVSLSFTPWKEWLGMKVDPEVLKDYAAKEIICHCLWEMTFYGFDENEIQKMLSSFDMTEEEMTAAILEAELEELEEEAESRKVLKDMLKNEIESSSSSEDGL